MRELYSAHRPAKNMGDAVRLFCLECMGSGVDHREFSAVRECPCEGTCSLWPYRFGKSPRRSRKRGVGITSGDSQKPLTAGRESC